LNRLTGQISGPGRFPADFWAWAIPQGYHGRIDIEATLQFSTAGMAPIVIKAALEEHQRTVPPAPSLMRRLRPEQSPPDTATQAGIADTFGWTEFWAWARLRGYHSRADLDSALDRSTSAMTPWEIREVLEGRLSVEDVPARPTRPDDDSPF
jgi:hypothetical protein